MSTQKRRAKPLQASPRAEDPPSAPTLADPADPSSVGAPSLPRTRSPKKPQEEGKPDFDHECAWRVATTKLARCVVTTLRSDGKIGMGSGLVVQKSQSGETRIERWDKDFIEALAFIGIKVVNAPKSKSKSNSERKTRAAKASSISQEKSRKRGST